jgi:hypothetical protein
MSTRAKRVLAWAAAIAASLAVFALYTRPQMMVTLSDYIWACFGN